MISKKKGVKSKRNQKLFKRIQNIEIFGPGLADYYLTNAIMNDDRWQIKWDKQVEHGSECCSNK